MNCELVWLDGVVRASRPRRVPVVYTRAEAIRVIGQLQGSRWITAMLIYGGGLCVGQCIRMRVKDEVRR